MKIKRIVTLILLFSAVSFFVFGLPRLIVIKKIACSTQYGSCQDELAASFNDLVGRRYVEVKNSLKPKLLENGLVKDYSYVYKPPATLDLYLIIRKSSYALGNYLTGKVYLVDEAGTVIEVVEKTVLPSLSTDKYTYEVGQRVPDKVMFALKTYTLLSSVYKVERSYLSDAMLEVKVADGPTMVFPLEGDPSELVGASRLIIEQLNSGEQHFKIEKDISGVVVDLRFRNPVLR